MNGIRKFEKSFYFAVLLSVVLLTGCGKKEKASVEKYKQIFASNYPLPFFAEKISGDPDRVVFPEISGDPAFWEPSINDISAMQQADVVLVNGATYEKWLEKVTLAKECTIDTSAPFKDKYIITKGESTHSHGPTGQHSHTGTAFTTWIDLKQAVQQAQTVKNALVIAEIGPKEKLEANFEELKSQLLSLNASIEAITKGNFEVPLFASHPVYQYFAHRYQLNIKSVLWEPDSFPDKSMWKELEKLHQEHRAAWMIWEDEPLPESVERLKERGIQSIVFSPCGNRPDDGDFVTVMKSNVANLRFIFASNR